MDNESNKSKFEGMFMGANLNGAQIIVVNLIRRSVWSLVLRLFSRHIPLPISYEQGGER